MLFKNRIINKLGRGSTVLPMFSFFGMDAIVSKCFAILNDSNAVTMTEVMENVAIMRNKIVNGYFSNLSNVVIFLYNYWLTFPQSIFSKLRCYM